MAVKHYVDGGGNYMGSFEGTHGVDVSAYTEVPSAPNHALDTWDGDEWVPASVDSDVAFATVEYVDSVAGGGGDVLAANYGTEYSGDYPALRNNIGLGTLATQNGTFSGTSSGTNTGDQTSISGNAGTATALATARAIYGNNFDGTAALAQVIASTYGGTGNGFTKFIGPATSEKTFTLPDANSVLATVNTKQSFTGGQRAAVTALTSSSASIAVDFDLNCNFSHTFTENTTLANPTNQVAGQSGCIVFTQHASSPKTLAFGSNWYFIGGDPSVTATNSAIDALFYYVASNGVILAELRKGWAA